MDLSRIVNGSFLLERDRFSHELTDNEKYDYVRYALTLDELSDFVVGTQVILSENKYDRRYENLSLDDPNVRPWAPKYKSLNVNVCYALTGIVIKSQHLNKTFVETANVSLLLTHPSLNTLQIPVKISKISQILEQERSTTHEMRIPVVK